MTPPTADDERKKTATLKFPKKKLVQNYIELKLKEAKLMKYRKKLITFLKRSEMKISLLALSWFLLTSFARLKYSFLGGKK